MKTSSIFTRRILSVLAVALVASSLATQSHARGDRAQRGRSGVITRDVSRSPGHVSKQVEAQNANGRSATRRLDRNFDKTTGTYTASGTTTLDNGKTKGHSVISEKTEDGRTTSAQRTGFGGKTATYESTRAHTDNGFTREVDVTAKNGAAVSKDVSVTTSDDGAATRSVTVVKTPAPTN